MDCPSRPEYYYPKSYTATITQIPPWMTKMKISWALNEIFCWYFPGNISSGADKIAMFLCHLCPLTCSPDEKLSLQWRHCRGSVGLTWSSRAWHVSNVARDQSGISRWHPGLKPRPADPHRGKVLQISVLVFWVKSVPEWNIPSINILKETQL